jgi:hypothetical protein
VQYIILIGDEKLNLDRIKAIEHDGSINRFDVTELGSRHCVDYGDDHIFYDDEGDSLEGYEEVDLDKLPFDRPHFVVMTYTSEERMKKVLQRSSFPTGIYIDNDYGAILPISEFIRLGMPVGHIP